jgi:hypothetical protein
MHAPSAASSLALSMLIWQAARAYRARFPLFLAATAVAQVPAWLFALLMGLAVSATLDRMLGTALPSIGVGEVGQAVAALVSVGGGQALAFGLLLVASGLVNVVGTVVSSGALAYLLARPAPEPAALRAAYQAVFVRLWPLFGAVLLAGFIICAVLGAGLMLYVVLFAVQYMLTPGGVAPPPWVQLVLWLVLGALVLGALGYAIYAFVRWALFVQAVILEDAGPADALRRSAALLRHRWWHTAALLSILALGQAVVGSVAASVATGLLGGQSSGTLAAFVSGLAWTATNVVYFPLAANALTLLYLGLRAREQATR